MKTDEAIRITSAKASRDEDRRRRQRRYLYSMSTRSACFVAAVLCALAGFDRVWPFLIALAIVLPYFAVVAANVRAGEEDDFVVGVPPRELDTAKR